MHFLVKYVGLSVNLAYIVINGKTALTAQSKDGESNGKTPQIMMPENLVLLYNLFTL